ncbi:MAG: hypothetical protein RBT65_08500 [Methanolobus sp.]|nr:hypothetical protein [Methanolobus sp.]
MIDEKGQVAIDFLLGISLVLFAISFTIQFIPGLFMSESAGESSLDYTAYRTATILVEDAGWWENNTNNGTDWESNPNSILRIGLAADDDSSSKLTNSPNLISKDKIEQFMLVNEIDLVKMLGMYKRVGDTNFSYGYNIYITQNSSNLILNNTSIARGKTLPDNLEVARITRVVLVEKETIAAISGDELTSESSSVATISVTGPFEENITVQISDLNLSGIDPALLNVKLDGNLLTQASDFTVYKKDGWTNSPLAGNLSSGDSIYLNFDHDLFTASTDHRLDLEFNNVTFSNSGPPFISYNNLSKALYEPAYLTVEVW